MQFRKLSLATLIGGLALAACAKDQSSAPLAPTSVARSATPLAPTCDYPKMRADAALYFANAGPVNEAINRMVEATSPAATKDKGFNVLTKVSSALSTAGAVIGSPAAGDAFVQDVLACMSVGTLPASLSFVGALSPNGLFEVVGGAGDPTGPVTSRGTPTYGAEPQAGQSWAGSAGGLRYLLYGNERDFSFTPETPAAVTAFELATVPTPITFSPAIVGGICQTTATNALIQSVSTILPLTSLSFCSGITSVHRQDRGLFATITHGVANMFSPATVYGFGVGGTGSLLSGLSPKAAVTFSPAAAGLAFVQQPKDSRRSLRPQFSPAVSVLVTTAAGTPVNGVLVTLTVYNNNGSYTLSNATATSGSGGAGIAVFPNLFTDKAGGYNFVASASIFGVATKSALSNRINIDGK
jgi:hypothetical protein